MTVDLTPEAFTPPPDRADVDGWLTEREHTIAERVRTVLRSIVVTAYERFLSTLTASGDFGALDSIPADWQTFVAEELGDTLGSMYLSGAVTAWQSAAGETRVPDVDASSWVTVVNNDAVAYQRTATNRLAAVGDDVWQHVRQQTVSAVQGGLPTEKLKERIEQVGEFSEFRADTIARTETVAAYNAGTYNGAAELGEYGPVEKSWLAAHDARVRDTHRVADGQTVAFDDDFVIGDTRMPYPLAEGAPPGEVVNCRCTFTLLYPGDTRPDGSIVEGDVVDGDNPVGNVDDEPAALPVPVDMSSLANAEIRMPLPGTTDIRQIVDVPTNTARGREFAETTARIADVHSAPVALPRTQVVVGGKAKSKGGGFNPGSRGPKPKRQRGEPSSAYMARVTEWSQRTPLSTIRVNDRGDGTHRLSYLHELGHRIDLTPPDGDVSRFNVGRWGSESAVSRVPGSVGRSFTDDAMGRFMAAAYDTGVITDAMRNWQDFAFTQYFREPKEVWARAYSQWAAETLGGDELLALRASQVAHGAYQWADDEFSRLGPLVADVLREKGLMT